MGPEKEVPRIEMGYYFFVKNEQGGATMRKMAIPLKSENLPLPHSGSEYVAYKDINPPKDQPS